MNFKQSLRFLRIRCLRNCWLRLECWKTCKLFVSVMSRKKWTLWGKLGAKDDVSWSISCLYDPLMLNHLRGLWEKLIFHIVWKCNSFVITFPFKTGRIFGLHLNQFQCVFHLDEMMLFWTSYWWIFYNFQSSLICKRFILCFIRLWWIHWDRQSCSVFYKYD